MKKRTTAKIVTAMTALGTLACALLGDGQSEDLFEWADVLLSFVVSASTGIAAFIATRNKKASAGIGGPYRYKEYSNPEAAGSRGWFEDQAGNAFAFVGLDRKIAFMSELDS